MSEVSTLLKRTNTLLATLEQTQKRIDTRGRVVLYDPATGELLPGYAPNPYAVNVWLPDNSRDNYAGRVSA